MATPRPQIGSVPFTEAINFFRRKHPQLTDYWDAMLGAEHACAFTVAGITKLSMLEDFKAAIEKIQKQGGTITDFRQDFDRIAAANGWSYKGKRGWRSRVIVHTNLRTSQAAGRWQQIQRTKDRRPWLIYETAGDERVREEHAAWQHTVLHADDAWWDTHYPPNGWGCRCIARTASDTQLGSEGLHPAKRSPPIRRTGRINTRTGEVYPPTPKGIDVGWDYNVGKSALIGPARELDRRIMRLPASSRAAAITGANQAITASLPAFRSFVDAALEEHGGRGQIIPVGWIEPHVLNFLSSYLTATIPRHAMIATTDKKTRRMRRPLKGQRDQAISVDDLKDMPRHVMHANRCFMGQNQ